MNLSELNYPPHRLRASTKKPHFKRKWWDNLRFSVRGTFRPPMFGGRP